MNKLLQKRFDEIVAQAVKVENSRRMQPSGLYGDFMTEHVDDELLLAWKVKAQDTLSKVCMDGSQHLKHFVEAGGGGGLRTNVENFKRMRAVFIAAKEDFEGGYLVAAHDLIRAEVFGSELEQASEFLKKGYAVPAAVIAGAVLETTLRELCTRNQIPNAKLDKMNADLAKAGAYNGIVQKRITHLAAVRNSAAHGNAAEFLTYDVAGMIEEIERFISQHLA